MCLGLGIASFCFCHCCSVGFCCSRGPLGILKGSCTLLPHEEPKAYTKAYRRPSVLGRKVAAYCKAGREGFGGLIPRSFGDRS